MSKHIIDLLNRSLEGEHTAIVQYLTHAYAMGEGELACEIEAIAREEMRHLDWLAETIVEMGGMPSINRGMMRPSDGPVPQWMWNDVLQEEDAIALYREHIETIDDPKVKRLLRRILSDEEAHHGMFNRMMKEAKEEKLEDKSGSLQNHTTKILDWGIKHEYTVVLQYLLHAYLATDQEVKDKLHDQAINEMQHLGWLAEEKVAHQGTPRIEHTHVDMSRNMRDMLKANIKVEREAVEEYGRHAKEISEEGLKRLLTRIQSHEVYHDLIFSDLLNKLEGKG
ncbi:MAG: ferritin-like domain-containing protein [Dehalococcoidia bacterium]|jgi:bacterioferritin|nr:ferritin-like domain-containing protein [Dehalococcoidia bacterium]